MANTDVVIYFKGIIWSLLLSLKNDEILFRGFLNLISNSSISNDKILTSWITVSSFLNELFLSLLKKLFCFNLSSSLVFALDKILVLFNLVILLVVNDWIFLFSTLPWSLEVRLLAIADNEVGEINCAFKEDLALKGWVLDKMLLTWWPLKIVLEDVIETLPTMLDELIILVGFL